MVTAPTLPELVIESQPAVLFVDDEPRLLSSLERTFRSEGLRVYTAPSSAAALEILESEAIQVIVSDHHMPNGTGIELLQQVRERYPNIVRLLLTGCQDMSVAMDAVNQGGVFRLLGKPWNTAELKASVRAAFDHARYERDAQKLGQMIDERNRELTRTNKSLEARVRQSTIELRAKHKEVRAAYIDTVRALAEAVDAKDAYTRGHSERVGVYASRIARTMGCVPSSIERIYLSGLLHDIGKIGVPDAILSKPGRLDDEEYEIMKQHPEIGARILEPVAFLADIVPCVRHHHEWYDGSDRGYPDRLRGSRIPLPSRIILVADTVEAMTSDRPYRRALPLEAVIDELHRFSGSQLDPTAVDACLSLLEREEDSFIEQASKFNIQLFLEECTKSA